MWWYIVVFIVALVISYAMMPKSEPQNSKPGNVDSPTAEEGGDVPVLFGTRTIQRQNIVWYGDVSTQAIKKKGGKK